MKKQAGEIANEQIKKGQMKECMKELATDLLNKWVMN